LTRSSNLISKSSFQPVNGVKLFVNQGVTTRFLRGKEHLDGDSIAAVIMSWQGSRFQVRRDQTQTGGKSTALLDSPGVGAHRG
jgi:hypothetical protein